MSSYGAKTAGPPISYHDGAAAPVPDLAAADATLPNQTGLRTPVDEVALGQAMQRGLSWEQAVAAHWPANLPPKLVPTAATLAAWKPLISARAAAGYYPR